MLDHVDLTDPFGECDLMEVGKIAQLQDEDGVNALHENWCVEKAAREEKPDHVG